MTVDHVQNQDFLKTIDMDNYLALFQLFNETTDDVLYIWNFADDKIYCTKDLSSFGDYPARGSFCYSQDEVYRQVYPLDRGNVYNSNQDELRKGCKKVKSEYRVIGKGGKLMWVSNIATTIYKDGVPVAAAGCISSRAMSGKIDIITGLLNHIKFEENMDERLKLKRKGYLLVFGINGMKDINAKYGRTYGDNIVRQVAEAIGTCVAPGISVYRMLGDEFAINMRQAHRADVEEIFADVQDMLKNSGCSVSAGAVYYDGSFTSNSSVLYQHAASAMESGGMGKLSFFNLEENAKYLEQLSILEELKNSVANECAGFFLMYQPVIRSDNYGLMGAESLLRFRSPTKGILYPDEFIPILEETGLIEPVGDWVCRTALAQCASWRAFDPNFRISDNISYSQLEREGMGCRLLKMVAESGLPGSALTVEVLENIRIQEYSQFNDTLRKWRQAGVIIAIDDFGSGYANFGYLKNIEADTIKIDRGFITDVDKNEYNQQLLQNIFRLAKSAHIKICCEGVEREEELMVLQGLRPNAYQGYLFSRPILAEEFFRKYFDRRSEEYIQREQAEEALWNRCALQPVTAKHFLPWNNEQIKGSVDTALQVGANKDLGMAYLQNQREKEQEDLRKLAFYHALLDMSMGYIELNLQTGQVLDVGGLFTTYALEAAEKDKLILDIVQYRIQNVVHPEDLDKCKVFLSTEAMRKLAAEGVYNKTIYFRRIHRGKITWVQMLGYIYREQASGDLYVILSMGELGEERVAKLQEEGLAGLADEKAGGKR